MQFEKFEKPPEIKPEEEKEKEREEEPKEENFEEKISTEYWVIEEKQIKREEDLEKERQKMFERAEKLGIELEKERPLSGDPRQRLFERSLEIDKMKDPIKERISKEYREIDPGSVEQMILELTLRARDLQERIQEFEGQLAESEKERDANTVANLRVAIDGYKRERQQIANIIGSFEEGDRAPLQDFVGGELRNVFERKWRGKEGFEQLKRAIFLKKVLNTLKSREGA